jgi:hypothetical protein
VKLQLRLRVIGSLPLFFSALPRHHLLRSLFLFPSSRGSAPGFSAPETRCPARWNPILSRPLLAACLWDALSFPDRLISTYAGFNLDLYLHLHRLKFSLSACQIEHVSSRRQTDRQQLPGQTKDPKQQLTLSLSSLKASPTEARPSSMSSC